eukprot:TRINITY_DN7612_c0_g1_i1.p1 TRINITY_DN7612_c0_g1~~TRINITY_DN7612_c0_g1_i1.p1  ORF type:complete len:1486 (-),score=621.94 TRINITY_DN7612_c0_g1_i1:145-4602(-)
MPSPKSKKMGSRKGNPLIRDAFKGCQDSFSGHPKLVRKLKAFYLSTDPDKFFEDFIWYLRFPISGVTERSSFVDKTLEFVAKFACSFLEKDEKPKDGEEAPNDVANATSADDEEEEELPLFIYRLFAWLLDHHEVEGADARLRVCQLLNKLLKYMGEEACIDDDLYNKIYDGMLERLKDKVAEIRSQAVTALQRLQDPRDEECPIIRAYLFHLAHDPNNVVRRTIVRCIGATRLTLPHILERTRDTDEHVRRAAYKFLAEKVHIKSLTIGQREGVLGRGLGERSEAVRRVVEKEMIPGWLRLSNNNIVQLLHHLDVGNSDQDTKQGAKSAPAGALNVLFMDTPYKELVNSFQYLDTDKLIPYEKLTPETAMYWRVLAEFFAGQNGPGAEEYLESILPELTPFCQYVRRYILDLEKDDEDVNWEFVAKELISMTTIYDLGDEVGRTNLCKLIKDLLTSTKTPATFINSLVTVFTKVEKNAQSRVDQVAEIISDLKDPLDVAPTDPMSPEYHSAPETPLVQPVRQDEEVIRAKQLQIAKLRVEMNVLRDQLDEAVTGQNFLIAQQIKAQMDQLEEEQAMLENQLSAAKAVGAAPPPSASTADPTPAAIAAQLDLSDSCPALDNPAVTLKCLRLLVATLQDPSITQLNATLLTLLEEFVMVSVQSELPAIRKEAITAMACCCLRSIEPARQHMLLLLQAAHIDVHEVRIAAIIAVVDLLMKHGLSSFITQEEPELDLSGGDSSVTPSRCADSADSHSNIDLAMESDLATRGATLTQSELNTQGGNSVVAILTKVLDEPDLELRTEVAEGLCKLLMIGSINSPKLLSRLLLIWYNPMTESDSKLRHILGTFFPLYSSMSKQHQLAMEAAFIPTMKVLFDAPVTSPLSEIDTEDVGMFFVHLTREDMLQSYDPNKKDTNILESCTTTVHDSLAMAVCNEILSSPDSFQTKVLIKILTSLALTHNNYVHLKEVKVLAESLLQNVKEKSCVRSLERFDKLLQDWLAKDPANNTSTTPGANKRKSKGGDGEESPDKSGDGTLTPTRSKKRILFSQSMIGNPLLNPESGQVLETTSEEDILSGTTLGEESFIISPVVVGNSSTRVDRESGSKEDGDQTLVEDSKEDSHENLDEIEVSANVSIDKDDTFKSAESSLTSDKGDADDTVEQTEETPKLTRKGRAPAKESTDILTKAAAVPAATIGIEILAASDGEEDEDDDIFSDASSVASINLSKLPRGAILDNSSEESADDEIFVKSQSPPKQKTAPVKKSTKAKDVSSIRSTSSSPIPSSNLSTRSSRSSVVSSPTPRSSRSSRSSRTAAAASEMATPPTVKKKTTSTNVSSSKMADETPVASKKTPVSKATLKTPTTTKSTTTPGSRSRSGRNNSPRINYRTGATLVAENTSSPNLVESAAGRKRTKAALSSSSAASSTTSSPQPKKKAGEGVSTQKGAKSVKKNLADSSDGSVENTPPARAKRTQSSSSSAASSRSARSARK